MLQQILLLKKLLLRMITMRIFKKIIFIILLSAFSSIFAEDSLLNKKTIVNKNSITKSFIEQVDVKGLELLPIQHEGRIKPLDTFARVHLLAFYGRRSIPGLTPTAWLLELLLDEKSSNKREIFDIKNPDLLNALNIKKNNSKKYSFSVIRDALSKIQDSLMEIQKIAVGNRTPVQNQIMDLYQKIGRYLDIGNSLSMVLPLFIVSNKENTKFLNVEANKELSYMDISSSSNAIKQKLLLLKDKKMESFTAVDIELVRIMQALEGINYGSYTQIFRVIPPLWPADLETWNSAWSIVREGRGSPKSAKYFSLWQEAAFAYYNKDIEKWNKTIVNIEKFTKSMSKPFVSSSLLKLEVFYNKLDPFTLSLALYILAFLFLAFSWVFFPAKMKLFATLWLVLGFLLHFAGIVLRVIIMDRAPVGTLYESVVVVAWVSVFLGLWLEWLRKNGVGILIATVSGSIMHFIALGYASDGDSMGMLVAVLNSNFWLSTHVITITIGYGGCLVAGLLGHIYLIQKLMSPLKDTKKIVELFKNMLWISIIALFFTLVGTVLGGIWADQSWGRFWGWDPKENGALLIVLWLLWFLHGRYALYFSNIGFAIGMVLTNVIVALAWFGVNLLNVGLHSYGFSGNIAFNLGLFSFLEILFVLVVYLYYRYRFLQLNLQKLKS